MKIVHCQDLSKKEVKREKLVFRTLNRSNTSKKIKSIAIIDTFIPPNQWVFSPLQDCRNPTPPCRMLIPARLWYSYSCSCRLPPSCIKQRVIYILITEKLATLFWWFRRDMGDFYLKSSILIWKRRGFSNTFSGPKFLHLISRSVLSVRPYSLDKSVVFPDLESKNTAKETAARSHCNAIANFATVMDSLTYAKIERRYHNSSLNFFHFV